MASDGLVDLVFSWSLRDVLNNQLFKAKVKKIPKVFLSVQDYLTSYIFPLIEETHADLCSSMMDLSQAPKCEIDHVEESKDHKPPGDLFYNMVVIKEGESKHDKEIYEPKFGDLIALSDVRPVCIDDLNRRRRSYLLALVTGSTVADEDEDRCYIKVLSSKPILFEQEVQKKKEPLFAVFLINMVTNNRIWKALHPDMKGGNMNVIKEVLCTDSTVGVDCDLCLSQDDSIHGNSLLPDLQSFNLNESQTDAVVRSIATKGCNHKSSVKLIWGPPGTGKTKTVGTLLWVLLRMKCRTLTCTPTNIALLEVTSRLLKLVRESLQHHNYGLGDIVLFGNEERMKIKDNQDLHDVFLDYRARELAKCFVPLSGWNHQLKSMIRLLEDAGPEYLFYLEEKKKEKQGVSQNEKKEGKNKKEKVEYISKKLKGKTKERRKKKIVKNLKEDKNKKILQDKILAQHSKQSNCLKPEDPSETKNTDGQEDEKTEDPSENNKKEKEKDISRKLKGKTKERRKKKVVKNLKEDKNKKICQGKIFAQDSKQLNFLKSENPSETQKYEGQEDEKTEDPSETNKKEKEEDISKKLKEKTKERREKKVVKNLKEDKNKKIWQEKIFAQDSKQLNCLKPEDPSETKKYEGQEDEKTEDPSETNKKDKEEVVFVKLKGKTKERRKKKIVKNLKEDKNKKIWQEKIFAQGSKQLNCLKPEDPSETKKYEGQEDEKTEDPSETNKKEKEEDVSKKLKGKTKERRKKKIVKNLKEDRNKKIRQEKIFSQERKQLNFLKPEDPSETKKTKGQEDEKKDVLTTEEFIKKRFTNIWMDLKFFIRTLCKHLPTSFISVSVLDDMIKALHSLESLRTLLHGSVTDEELKCVFVGSEDLKTTVCSSNTLLLDSTRNECLQILKSLHGAVSVPDFMDKRLIGSFCLKHAYLIFSTASSSAKLHTDGMTPLEVLVIDEAAQLKECESAIPLQLPGVRHAILIGDERQLPAMVQSKISEKAEFGRSLFERLVSLGHKKHLLNIQYRMHPSISIFPNTEFYGKQILDAPNVKERSHERHFLQGNMYVPYSFINVAYGMEQHDGHGRKNMVEVAVVSEIVKSLFKASVSSRQKLSVGVISPYKAQVFAIKDNLGDTYDTPNNFSVSVRTVDGFQGGEEDVIIISTVRSNGKGSVGFLANLQRTNVALTRARYCLWVLGNSPTLVNSGSIWRKLVLDTKDRGCFLDADKDESLKEAMIAGLVELGEFDKLLNMDSLLFVGARWKVLFGNDFWKSMAKIKRCETRKLVIALLTKLVSGWRHPQKRKHLYLTDGTSSELLKVYKVDGLLNLVWTVDILRENFKCIQVLKVWDILPLQEIPKLVKQLDVFFGNYRVDDMSRCKFKCAEGKLEVPMSWEISSATTLMDLHNPEPVKYLSSRFASLHLGKEPNASAPLYGDKSCWAQDGKAFQEGNSIHLDQIRITESF